MKNTLFAQINGKKIIGEDIIRAKKRLLTENEEVQSFAYTPNEDNNGLLNAEALQSLINTYGLIALAKFEGLEADEEISQAIFELRNQYEDEAEWESVLHDLKIDDSNLRQEIANDLIIKMLIESRIEYFENINAESIEKFYDDNVEFMKHPPSYTFIELEAPSKELLTQAAEILSLTDSSEISKAAEKNNLSVSINTDIPKQQLPESLQSVLEDLEKSKVGFLPMEDDSIVLIKLLKKREEVPISLEEAYDGLEEYLTHQRNQKILDSLLDEVLEKCDIQYFNTKLLKELK
ncbi:MAG: peptidylprolyl isomerase [Brevinemataceae bacterium]